MEVMLVLITLISVLVAVTMSVVASRLMIEERRRSDARVGTLAAEIQGQDLPIRETAVTTPAELFAAPPTMPARSPLALVFTVGALVVGAAMALAVVFAGAGTGPSTATEARATVRAPIETVPAAPLELVALGHEQEAEGMTVRGVLRNPASGSEIRQLSAVVQLWTHDGVFVASARAPVQAATLQPGGETTFVVSVPAAAGADRYRVSFSIDDHVVPHVDVRS